MEKIKNKICLKTLFALVVMLISACFCCTLFSLNSKGIALAEDTDSNFHKLLEEAFDISQDGHRFVANDFTTMSDELTAETVYVIYKNKNISIKHLKTTEFNIQIRKDEETTYTEKNSDNMKTLYHFPRGNNITTYYVLSVNDIPAEQTDRTYTIKLQAVVSAGEGLTSTVNATIRIIQTKTQFNNFYASNAAADQKIEWTYTDKNYNNRSVILPENDETYSSLTLKFPYGTEDNPIYVDFNYLGEHYVISRYKTNDGDIITENVNSTSDNKTITLQDLAFTVSGIYEVKIYDKTAADYNTSNLQTCRFTIVNPTKPFYFKVTNAENNAIVMNGEYTNTNINVEYVNISDIASSISSIQVARTYQPTSGGNITDRETYSLDQIENCSLFTDDGSYTISLIKRNGGVYASYSFQILQTVKGLIKIGDKTIQPSSTQPENDIEKKTEIIAIPSTYTTNGITLTTKTNNTFEVSVAKNASGIEGISNNSRTASAVNLTVKGVGNITVYATHNGKQLDLGQEIFENGDTLPTLTEKGTYFFKITDQMGVSKTLSFTITVKLNVASILLIVISALILVVLVVYIIMSRSKLKVR
ncbi:MAG: hypothetical protein IJS74_03150 [Clostridia bacterium]|nr:hypothetical protein [Clostridia bacterium]